MTSVKQFNLSSIQVIRVLVLAQAIATLLAFAPGVIEDRWIRLGLTTLFVQWVTLLSLLIISQVQKRFPSLSVSLFSVITFAVLLSCTLLVSLVAHAVLTSKGWQAQVDLHTFVIHNLLIASILAMIGLQFYAMHLDRQKRIAAQSRAELDALQARIRPHFLFNSLNTAAELTHINPAAAEQALLNLSSLFRAALKAGDNSCLLDEMALVDAYLSLEQWRLGQRLVIHRRYPDQLPNIPLPSLTIQPLVENAVRHGVESIESSSGIDIQVLLSDQHLTLLIENPVMAGEQGLQGSRFKGNGMAIDNIRQRLALLYDDRARLTTGQVDGKYRVKLVIPVD